MLQILLFLSAIMPVATADAEQQPLGSWEDPAAHVWRQTQTLGLSTFAKMPFQDCFSPATSHEPSYDIAVLGAPFDLGVTGRPGERSGPLGIRLGSQRLGGHNIFTGKKVLDGRTTIVDCGDADLTVLDKEVALEQLYKAHKRVSTRPGHRGGKGAIPRILALGGDHTTTLPALRSAHERWGPVSVIHFDSHLDTWDPEMIGGGVSLDAGVNHGTWLHIAHHKGFINDDSIHVGTHAPVMRLADWGNDRRCGFDSITSRDFDTKGVAGIVNDIRNRIGENYVYISVDIDVLDPAFAPGTGTPEPGGLTSRELLAVLDGLIGLNVIGADVVEVAPAYDSESGTTALAAAQVGLALLSLMVEKPVQ
ncbi:arginase [Poronia punctata]|nr:arginase [Poronia punctata]